MALILSGELAIAGPEVSVRLRADGDGMATVVVEGALGHGRRALRSAASRASSSGLSLTVWDGRGRRLASVGPDVRSPLGRLLVGAACVRPTVPGIVAALRGAAAQSSKETGDRR